VDDHGFAGREFMEAMCPGIRAARLEFKEKSGGEWQWAMAMSAKGCIRKIERGLSWGW